MFIGCNATLPFSFCFSAARRREPPGPDTFGRRHSGEAPIGQGRAAEKQKEDFQGSPGYKHCTPNGVGDPDASSQAQIEILKMWVSPSFPTRAGPNATLFFISETFLAGLGLESRKD